MAKTQTASPEANFVDQTIFTGDNLHVLRGLNSACVDLIYLDPPFNSKRIFEAPIGSEAQGAVFEDIWKLSDVDHWSHGDIADQNQGAYDVITASRTAHGSR